MSHRGQAHARRRCGIYPTPFRELDTEDGTAQMLSRDFDATTYDDVIPHRLRGTLILDEDGEPASLTDLIRADVRA